MPETRRRSRLHHSANHCTLSESHPFCCLEHRLTVRRANLPLANQPVREGSSSSLHYSRQQKRSRSTMITSLLRVLLRAVYFIPTSTISKSGKSTCPRDKGRTVDRNCGPPHFVCNATIDDLSCFRKTIPHMSPGHVESVHRQTLSHLLFSAENAGPARPDFTGRTWDGRVVPAR